MRIPFRPNVIPRGTMVKANVFRGGDCETVTGLVNHSSSDTYGVRYTILCEQGDRGTRLVSCEAGDIWTV